jgi:serine O-acetyltransferase
MILHDETAPLAGERVGRTEKTGRSESRDDAQDRARDERTGLERVVDELCRPSRRGEGGLPQGVWKHHALPSRDTLITIVETLRGVLFPGYFGPQDLDSASMRFHVGSALDRVGRLAEQQVLRGLCFACELSLDECPDCRRRARDITRSFLAKLPSIKKTLETDVRATYQGDPAATSPDEAVFCYPGITAITSYRLAHELWELGVPLIPRMITEHAHTLTGIDIHPGARIGESFFIDHGTGVVIGETCVIGKRVRIYQGVTLGARSFPVDGDGKPIKGIDRHPIVEDDVIIYSGATLLGRIVIGRGSVIGGNVWLTRDLPPHSRITQVGARRETFQGGGGI